MSGAPRKPTLVLNFPVSTSPEETLARIEKISKSPEHIGEPSARALLYLRAASGRASLALSAFYLFLVAEASTDEERKAWTYAQQVIHTTVRFSAISTVALCVRAIFDHSRRDALCAKLVTGLSKANFAKVAAYWGKRNNRDAADAEAALHFIKDVLERGAIPMSIAKKSECVLARRVAFMKALADRESAHISLQHYEYTLLDVAHVVAATALFGAVIHHFDYPGESGPEYLVKLDEAANASASQVLPHTIKSIRLFEKQDIAQMFRTLLKGRLMSGADYLSGYLAGR
jgi:hypothetical protein